MSAKRSASLRVLHIGSGRYAPRDRQHTTYQIWSELAVGFGRYAVAARSTGERAQWRDGNLDITLLRSWSPRDSEFFVTQFACMPLGLTLQPDVIVCQSPVMGGFAALRIAKRTSARVLMEIHSDAFIVPARIGSPLWLLQRLSRIALRRSTLIRVLSPTMREQVLDRYGRHLADRVKVLPPRVDLARFQPKTEPRRAGAPLQLVMVGSLTDRKGQLRLIDALRGAPFPLELHLVGDGPDRAACERRAAASSPLLRIRCHGQLDPDAVSALLRQADVFVMYSTSEGTPRAMMEAMAAGLPVVTTDAGFCSDLVDDGIEGFVLGADPDCEIQTVLAALDAEPGLAAKLGAAARQRAVRDFDSVALFERYRALIAETAAR